MAIVPFLFQGKQHSNCFAHPLNRLRVWRNVKSPLRHKHWLTQYVFVCYFYTPFILIFFVFNFSLKIKSPALSHIVRYRIYFLILSNFSWWQISMDLFFPTQQTNKQTHKRTNIRVINICVCFYNERRYSIFVFFFWRKSNRWGRNRHGNEEFVAETKRCLNVSKHHFSMCSRLIKHTHIHMVREAESENVLCFCYFLHALSLFRHFSLFISFDALSFPFVSFPSLNPPAHTHTFHPFVCAISNIVECVFVWACFFYPILDSIYLDYCSFSLFLPIFSFTAHTHALTFAVPPITHSLPSSPSQSI